MNCQNGFCLSLIGCEDDDDNSDDDDDDTGAADGTAAAAALMLVAAAVEDRAGAAFMVLVIGDFVCVNSDRCRRICHSLFVDGVSFCSSVRQPTAVSTNSQLIRLKNRT